MRIIVGLTVLALMSGCGSKTSDGQSTVISTKDGTVAVSKDGNSTVAVTNDGQSVHISTANAWPATLPTYIPRYPGATVTTTFAGSSSSGGKSGGMVAFTTADAPERVVSFYKDEAARAGLGEVATMATGGSQMFTATDKATHRDLTIQATPDDGKTTVSLTYGMGS